MPKELDFLAMNIVNQLFDLAEVPVKKRQEINDTCDEFVKKLVSGFIKKLSSEQSAQVSDTSKAK
jgi:hypothetical protein